MAAIHNLSNRSSTLIASFSFSPLLLRNHKRNNSGWHLLEKATSKLRLCGFLPWIVYGLYGSDVTVQATNWLADGRAPGLVRHALTALRCASVNSLLLEIVAVISALCAGLVQGCSTEEAWNTPSRYVLLSPGCVQILLTQKSLSRAIL